MQRHTPKSVGDVIRDILEETSLKSRMEELQAANLWSKIVGSSIASQTAHPTVKRGVMSVGVANASLRQELLMSRSYLKDTINQYLGKEVITEIKFTS